MLRSMLLAMLVSGGMATAMAEIGNGRGDGPREVLARRSMVEQQVRQRGVTRPEVLAALADVPRHLFVPAGERDEAYEDHPLAIGYRQTISQPYIVGLMTALAGVGSGDRVLEIGTGSGYQAAVLSRLVSRVYSMEIVEPLGERARETLSRLGYDNVEVRIGDGYGGWPEEAPFDAILLTAAPPQVPLPLLRQLKIGGRMVVPVGESDQSLEVLTKRADGGFDRQDVLPVRFVPMTGEAQLH
ncbi:MAG: protein-L-isoaspartate(D-aspartate) O-methyltransferase [Acidobacteriota bacterium]|nr:protein-L-isoaspartate(D-aspartate) O-methyltransferase [Acidobacteriota bacterium]